MWQSLMQVQTSRDGVITRRSFLRNVGFGAGAAAGLLGWKEAVALHAAELRKQGMACILLFMRGGPSQMETFDPKPDTDHGGPTKAISTAASGIQIAEHWPKLAGVMKDVSIIRSMTNREGEHQRATYMLHTGYAPSGSVKHPSFGSIVANEIAPEDVDLPHFVSIGNRATTIGSGFLGMSVAPFIVARADRMPDNVTLPRTTNANRLSRRMDLMKDLEQDFSHAGGGPAVEAHQALYGNARRMVLSPRLKAFDISQESESTRERYGKTAFGNGCLLARRLVEAGVTFVEVEANGWDTHRDNFDRVKKLAGQVDPAMSALIGDLRQRGMLDRTLVIWMGEFGRTPKINGNTGRDHYPRAFNVVLAGGGIHGGQVVGATSSDGMQVTQRPVTVPDLFCTFCQVLKINARKQNMSTGGRPIKIVDGGAAVNELLG